MLGDPKGLALRAEPERLGRCLKQMVDVQQGEQGMPRPPVSRPPLREYLLPSL